MNLAKWHSNSLRLTLLLVLLPGLLLVVVAEVWLTWRTAHDAANAAYDRSLLGAIKSMDSNISTASGGIGVELPYRMLEFFELTASGRVFFQVSTEDGLVNIGNVDLPPPPRPLVTGEPQFREVIYYGEPVRLGSYARVLDPPLPGVEGEQRIVIQVAETLESRNAFTRDLVLQSLRRDLALILAATGLLIIAVNWSLRPLERLRDEVRSRAPLDLTPVSQIGIPADVQPLVEAINFHVERNRLQSEARRRFVDDASHQLRTPLTTLTTQVGFALRQPDPQEQRAVLEAIKLQLDETLRQTNQMLALGRAESAELAPEPVNLTEFAEKLARKWWGEARGRHIDLGMETQGDPVWVLVQPTVLTEALSNLLHNAVRYTPQGGRITVGVSVDDAHAVLSVVDDGPGIPKDEISRAGERFFRGSNVHLPGTGLGLAIVKAIAERFGGQLVLGAGPGHRGLCACVRLPIFRHPIA